MDFIANNWELLSVIGAFVIDKAVHHSKIGGAKADLIFTIFKAIGNVVKKK